MTLDKNIAEYFNKNCLTLKKVALTPTDIEAIITFLRQNPQAHSLYLRNCVIAVGCGEKLGQAFQTISTLRTINILRCNFTAEDIQLIENASAHKINAVGGALSFINATPAPVHVNTEHVNTETEETSNQNCKCVVS